MIVDNGELPPLDETVLSPNNDESEKGFMLHGNRVAQHFVQRVYKYFETSHPDKNMITSGHSSDESDDSDMDMRCFKRDLFNAVERSHYDQLISLLESNKHDVSKIINTRDDSNRNNTLLHVALKSRKRRADPEQNEKIIKALVKKGANATLSNDLGETPEELFQKRYKTEHQSTDCLVDINQQLSSSSMDPTTTSIQPCDRSVDDAQGASVDRNPSYSSSGLKLSLHGVIYQLQLLVLFLHRATKQFHSYYLATELDEAEKFDDIVLKYKVSETDRRWTCRFLQAKHVLNISSTIIKKEQLFSLNEKLPFSLHKYLKSFCKIKNNTFFNDVDLEDFIMCTNAKFDLNALNYFTEDKLSGNDKILGFPGINVKKYKLRSNSKRLLFNNWRIKLYHDLSETYLNEFLEKFTFVVEFPNKNELSRLISEEIGDAFKLLSTDLVTNAFTNNILDWLVSYKDGKSHYLIIENGKYFIKSIKNQIRTLMVSGLSISYPVKLQSYNISYRSFPDGFRSFIDLKNNQILYLVTKYPLLSSIKVEEFIRTQRPSQKSDGMIFLTLNQLQKNTILNLVLTSFSSLQSHDLLVINCEGKTEFNSGTIRGLYSQLIQIIKNNAFKKIIFIASPKDALTRNVSTNFGISCQELVDQTAFGDLDDISQSNLLKKEVTFQGKKMCLDQLININSAYKILSEDLLTMLIENREINIGRVSNEFLDFNIGTPYIHRTLSRKKIQLAILYDEHFLVSNIILLAFATEKDSAELAIPQKFIFKLQEIDRIKRGIIVYYSDTDGGTCSKVFETLQATHPDTNIFWAQYQRHWLALERFHGDIDTLIGYTDESLEPEYLLEKQFGNLEDSDGKYSILAGNPGMGKSTFLHNLSNYMKNSNATLWVIQICLNDLSYHKRGSGFKSLDDITFFVGDTSKANSFVLDIVSPEGSEKGKSSFERELLFLALNESSPQCMFPKVVLLLDGFDEICPIYKEKTIILLKALRKSNVSKVWITTRSHEQDVLERELEASAYCLNPFTNPQKKYYLRTIFYRPPTWANENTHNVQQQVALLCEDLSDITLGYRNMHAQAVTEMRLGHVLRSSFTDNPLQCRMIAEILSRNNSIDPYMFDLPLVYAEFADIKFSNYYKQKTGLLNSVAANEMRIRDMNSLKHIHGTFAITELYPEQNKIIPKNLDTTELIRVGFLIKSGNGISFLHRSFAEYFASEHIAENFEDSMIQDILSGNFFWEGVSKVVRAFLAKNLNFLSKLEGDNHKIFENICIKNKKSRWLLVKALEKENEKILKSILKHAKNCCSEQLRLLKVDLMKDSNFTKHTDRGRKVLSLVDIILYDNDIFDFLYSDIMNRTSFPIHFCAYAILHKWICCYTGANSNSVLDRIFQIELEELGYKADDLLTFLQEILFKTYGSFTILHIAAMEGKLNLILNLFLWIKQKIVSFQSETLADHIENKLKVIDEIICNLHFMLDGENRTFLHLLENNNSLEDFLTFLWDNFGRSTVLNLITQCNSADQTLFHSLVRSDRQCAMTVETILTFLKTYLEVEVIRDILFKVDELRQTAFHRIAYVSEKNTSFQTMLTFLLSVFDSKNVAELFRIKDIAGKTVLHRALYSDNVLIELLNYFKTNFDKTILNALICSRDNNNQNLVHSVVQNVNSHKTLVTLMKFINEYFGEGLLKARLLEKDIEERTAFHYACEESSETIDSLLRYTKNEFDLEFTKELVIMEDCNGRTGLHYSALNNDQSGNPIKTILSFLKLNYNELFFQEVVFKRDSGGRTVAHLVQEGIGDCRLEILIGCLQEFCDDTVILKSLLTLDNKGQSPLNVRTDKNTLKFHQQTYIYLIHALPKDFQNMQTVNAKKLLTLDEISLLYSQIHYLFGDDDMFNILSKILDEYTVRYRSL